ncbi:hypothetical protein ACFWFF_23790 [Streptomyces sp. NPDC060223]|uniref:hypothetical protein n=1 Tax=unclassified Streptomyces TaxID=2593676 RepID=UPI003626E117
MLSSNHQMKHRVIRHESGLFPRLSRKVGIREIGTPIFASSTTTRVFAEVPDANEPGQNR